MCGLQFTDLAAAALVFVVVAAHRATALANDSALMGIDHERLTHRRHAGRNFRLTDVAGRVVHAILA